MDVVYCIIKESVSMKSLSFDKRVEQPRIMRGVATATIPNQKRWMELAALLIMFACFFITSNAVAQSQPLQTRAWSGGHSSRAIQTTTDTYRKKRPIRSSCWSSRSTAPICSRSAPTKTLLSSPTKASPDWGT